MELDVTIWIKTVLPLALQLFGLLFIVIIDPYVRNRDKNRLILVILIAASLIAQNTLDDVTTSHGLLIANEVYGYAIRPVIIVLFLYVLCPRMRKRYAWIVVGLNALLYMTAFFAPLTFGYDADGNFVRGPLGFVCFALSFALLIVLVAGAIRERSLKRFVEVAPPIVIAALIIAASIADVVFPNYHTISYLTITLVSSILFVIILLHLALARENERLMQANQRIRIVMSQIQPHFLFNTLSTIQALCMTDPEKAFATVEKFGAYLRNNISSLDQEEMIPFSKELEHTRIYAQIEQIRFPSVRIEYDIRDDDFPVPALILQPLVENAIRHGIRGMDDGCVTVSATRAMDHHRIIVSDNGRGFDPAKLAEQDDTHIGIANVRERVETMCGGTMNIESGGEGTTVTILIPAEEERL